MTDDDAADRGGLGDRDSRERVLVVVMALVGIVSTLALSSLPVVAGVAHGLVFGVVVGTVNVLGYLAIVVVAVQAPLRWDSVRRAAWVVIAVSVVGAVWALVSDRAAGGADFLLAMSGLMAVLVVVTSHLVAERK
ncbi:hypothetical protein GTV32_16130 [Gordonia sp. SID5947]|uniref:hypothetical protein n=1 Tax=Gordonia sp. SID5947 TaxID=2690315 RepID=UPI001371FCA0|nr:hypothetical protein [Gordonia sp. SID5947]MYR07734.1 hypothetical protein [Gordonia sp. SID5947]